jgi:hypothetical protein
MKNEAKWGRCFSKMHVVCKPIMMGSYFEVILKAEA